MTVSSVFLQLTTRNTTITGTHRNSQPIAAVSFPQFFVLWHSPKSKQRAIGWIPLDEGAYLHVGSDAPVIQVVGVVKEEMAGSGIPPILLTPLNVR
jgi:hypothetical protein